MKEKILSHLAQLTYDQKITLFSMCMSKPPDEYEHANLVREIIKCALELATLRADQNLGFKNYDHLRNFYYYQEILKIFYPQPHQGSETPSHTKLRRFLVFFGMDDYGVGMNTFQGSCDTFDEAMENVNYISQMNLFNSSLVIDQIYDSFLEKVVWYNGAKVD